MKSESPQSAFLHRRILGVLVLFFAGSLLALLALGFYPVHRRQRRRPGKIRVPVPRLCHRWRRTTSRGRRSCDGTTAGAISEQPSAENLAPAKLQRHDR
jgi:hypothetical protein